MRDDGYAGDAESFNLQSLGQMLQTAAPAAMQGAAAGSALGPWGALVGGLGAGAMSMASQAQGPSPSAVPPPRPAVQAAPPRAPAPISTPTLSASMPIAAPVSSAAPPAPAPFAAPPAPAPVPAFAAAQPTAPAGAGSAGTLNQVMTLLGTPQVQALLSSLASGQRPSTANLIGGAGAALSAFAPRAGAAAAEAAEAEDTEDTEADGGGAVGWLIATGVARPRA